MTDRELTALYERHVDTVYRLCYTYLRSGADAEDAAQTTFLKLIRSGKHFSGPDHEKAWLIVTASNVCRDLLRRSCRKDRSLEEGLPEPAAPEQHSEVLSAVLELPEELRQLVYLTYYEGYTSAELSRLLHRPASTLRNQLAAARKLLRDALGGDLDGT